MKIIIILISLICSATASDYPYEDIIPESIHPILHVVLPAAMCLSVGLLPIRHRIAFGASIGMIATIGKEVFDVMHGYPIGWGDIGYGALGSTIGAVILYTF